MVRIGALALLVLAMPVALHAQTAPPRPEKAAEYTPPAWPKGPTETALLGRLALITLLALALGGIIIVIARRIGRLPVAQPGNAVPLEIVGTVSLGSGCTLHLLQVEQASFVVGADGTGLKAIQLVAEPFETLLETEASVPTTPAAGEFLYPTPPEPSEEEPVPSWLQPRRIA